MRRIITLIVKNWSLIIGIGIVCILYTISGIGCPILFLTGVPCFGCGMTRAYIHLLRLDFAGAIHCHPMCVVLPFLCILWFWCWEKHSKLGTNMVLGIGIVMFIAVYAYRVFVLKDTFLTIDISNGFIYKVVYSIWEGRKLLW